MEAAQYGDFTNLVMNTDMFKDEKLLRTYFHQLIAGIKFLHEKNMAHLDLKMDNLLLGSDFRLKITDFDSSYQKGDSICLSRGTKNYRAPEIKSDNCDDPQAADAYSAGIILFVLKAKCFPYMEDVIVGGQNLYEDLQLGRNSFWTFHSQKLKTGTFEDDFKDLFTLMVKEDPVERATLEEVKKSKWFLGPIYSQEELTEKIQPYLADFDLFEKKRVH